MTAETALSQATDRQPVSAGKDFARRYSNMLCELRMQPGIQNRIERLMAEFAEEHPNVRGSYLSRHVDPTYFSDGSCGWEAEARPKLQGLAIEGENLFEFIAFTNGIRLHTTPISTIMNVEEVWLEAAPEEPFACRICLYHSFPANTILTAPDADSQDSAAVFLQRLRYLRGF